jgi:hypothetical protein
MNAAASKSIVHEFQREVAERIASNASDRRLRETSGAFFLASASTNYS